MSNMPRKKQKMMDLPTKMPEIPTEPAKEGVTIAQYLSSPVMRFDMDLPHYQATPPSGEQSTVAVVKIPCYPSGIRALADTAELTEQAEKYYGISSFDMEGIDLDELWEFLYNNDQHDWFK